MVGEEKYLGIGAGHLLATVHSGKSESFALNDTMEGYNVEVSGGKLVETDLTQVQLASIRWSGSVRMGEMVSRGYSKWRNGGGSELCALLHEHPGQKTGLVSWQQGQRNSHCLSHWAGSCAEQ